MSVVELKLYWYISVLEAKILNENIDDGGLDERQDHCDWTNQGGQLMRHVLGQGMFQLLEVTQMEWEMWLHHCVRVEAEVPTRSGIRPSIGPAGSESR